MIAPWGRLHYGGKSKRWHLLTPDSQRSQCGRMKMLKARLQTALTLPAQGRFCKFCAARWVGVREPVPIAIHSEPPYNSYLSPLE